MKLPALTLLLLALLSCVAVGATEDSPDEVVDLPDFEVDEPTPDDSERIAYESASATKFQVPVSETPRSLFVVTQQQMNDMGVQTLEDALLYVPGVYGSTYGLDSRGDWSKIRGVAPQDYRDGLKSLFGFYNNTRPHPYTLEKVTVIKGPTSTLYGQGSLGGIVNVASKRPLAAAEREVMLEYGSDNHKEGGIDLTGRLTEDGEFLYRFVGVYRDSDTQVNHVEDDLWVLAPSLSWVPTENTSITLLARFQEVDSGLTTQFLPLEGTLLPGRNIPTDTFVGEPDYDRYDAEQGSLTLLMEHEFHDDWSFQAKGRYTDSFADYRQHWPAYLDPDGDGISAPTINPDGTVTRTIYDSEHGAEIYVGDVRLSGDLEWGRISHKMALGLDYQHAETDNDTYYGYAQGGDISIYNPVYGNLATVMQPTDNPAQTTEQIGVYLSNYTTLYDTWILSYGVREDWVETEVESSGTTIDDEAFTFDLGLMYRFGNGLAPYVSYAESFSPIAGTDISGSSFDPTEGRQYEAGVKYQPVEQSLYTASIFQITEQNRPTSAPGGGGQVQTGEAEIHGIELSAQHRWRDLYVQLGYTYLDTEITESNDGDEGNKLPSIPDHLATAWLTYAPENGYAKGFRFGFGGRYVGNTWGGNNVYKSPDYWVFDGLLGYQYKDLNLALNVYNIFDEIYLASVENATAFYGERREIRLTATYSF